MASRNGRAVIAGSERIPLHGAKALGSAPENERLEVTVRVRRKAPIAAVAAMTAGAGASRATVSREQYEAAFGADENAIKAVKDFALEHNLVVVGADAARRSVFLSGTVKDFERAFQTRLEHFAHEGGTYRGRDGGLTVPEQLAPLIEGVFGLDDRPVAKPHFQRYRPPPAFGIAAHAANKSFTPLELARLYNFPEDATGKGQCIALIELGGGYRPADLTAYFRKIGLKTTPKVTAVRVDGATNHPSTPDSADGEVMLDIEVAAAVAPAAHIVVYFAPNTDKGFLDAITMAVHDKVNKPSVISISWGAAESGWTAQAMDSFDQAFQGAAALGVTVCAAAGDNGSADGVADGHVHVDFPASSPHVLGCGGTRLVGSAAAVTNETVWNDGADSSTGGGFSVHFAIPGYQEHLRLDDKVGELPVKPGRGVPDVAGDADPVTGYVVRVDGQDQVIGGTSAVAPLWAGLIALLNESRGKPLGFLNPLLYAAPVTGSGSLRDVQSGSNGAWKARKGWDPCTGWGSPDGKKLRDSLKHA